MKQLFHHYKKWECLEAGFFDTVCDEPDEEAKKKYSEFLGNTKRFEKALQRVLNEWTISCEQFLSNESMNRIAWLGQASMCIETGIPSCFRGGFKLLSEKKQKEANEIARKYLNKWIRDNERNSEQIYLFVEE
jgi:hypothetical protein